MFNLLLRPRPVLALAAAAQLYNRASHALAESRDERRKRQDLIAKERHAEALLWDAIRAMGRQ